MTALSIPQSILNKLSLNNLLPFYILMCVSFFSCQDSASILFRMVFQQWCAKQKFRNIVTCSFISLGLCRQLSLSRSNSITSLLTPSVVDLSIFISRYSIFTSSFFRQKFRKFQNEPYCLLSCFGRVFITRQQRSSTLKKCTKTLYQNQRLATLHLIQTQQVFLEGSCLMSLTAVMLGCHSCQVVTSAMTESSSLSCRGCLMKILRAVGILFLCSREQSLLMVSQSFSFYKFFSMVCQVNQSFQSYSVLFLLCPLPLDISSIFSSVSFLSTSLIFLLVAVFIWLCCTLFSAFSFSFTLSLVGCCLISESSHISLVIMILLQPTRLSSQLILRCGQKSEEYTLSSYLLLLMRLCSAVFFLYSCRSQFFLLKKLSSCYAFCSQHYDQSSIDCYAFIFPFYFYLGSKALYLFYWSKMLCILFVLRHSFLWMWTMTEQTE